MLDISIVRSDGISPEGRSAILSLCNAAYEEDLADLFETFGPATHVIGRVGQELASHAMWVTRFLQAGDGPVRRTAYVELVATLPAYQGRGFASAMMRRLAAEVPDDYEMAALCPATSGIYSRLGWRFWRGPLSVRMPSGALEPAPDEQIMVLALPGRPEFDLHAPLSAEWRDGELW